MDSVPPLRISKSMPASSPTAAGPLSEISPMSQRRNSPSFNHATKKTMLSRESSPLPSPRAFWSSQTSGPSARFDQSFTERSTSPVIASPKRRPSVERLKQASRVKNSNIFALETKDVYDPTTLPLVERPTANRPLSQQLANNTFTQYDSLQKENKPLYSPERPIRARPDWSPANSPTNIHLPASPEKQASPSPTKSSLARVSKFAQSSPNAFDCESGARSEEEAAGTPRAAYHRNNKSVTFHRDPPVINEYEQPTPEPSVAASDREASWDSDDFYDQDVSFERGSSAEHERDDSFDADLENADKTPVVLPEDWTRMSPAEARKDLVNDDDDVFDSSPIPRPILGRSESVTSDGESRPLPPIPGFIAQTQRRDSDPLAAAAERASLASRSLPSPPKRASCSKDDILKMTQQSSLTMRDRLQMRIAPIDEMGPSPSGSSDDTEHAPPEELTITNLDTGEKMEVLVGVTETPVEEDALPDDLPEFTSPPRISRESILRKVRNTKYDFEDEDDVDESELHSKDEAASRPSYAELAMMDPDQPVPSRETSRDTSDHHQQSYEFPAQPRGSIEVENVKIKEEPIDDDEVDMAAIPAIDMPPVPPPRSPTRMDDYDRDSSVLRHHMRDESEGTEDDRSRYSNSLGPDAESTLLQMEPQTQDADDGKESLQDAMQLLTVKDYSGTASSPEPAKQNPGTFTSLPACFETDDYDFGLSSYITPSPPASENNHKQLGLGTAVPILQPSAEVRGPMALPEAPYSVPDVSPPQTPDSVIRHSSDRLSDVSSLHGSELASPARVPSPEIPERKATIKTGGRLKARPSGTPADLEMMASQRRLVSSEHPVPAIPHEFQAEMHATRSVATEAAVDSSYEGDVQADSLIDTTAAHEANNGESRKVELKVDIPNLGGGNAEHPGLDLDAAFDRVIETQKKGYSTRQSDKVVIASNRNFSGESNETEKSEAAALPMSTTGEARPTSSHRQTKSANSSPRKPSADPFLKTEPWNGKTRRKSVRNASAQKGPNNFREAAAPPLPGQESAALGVVDEDYAAGSGSLEDEVAEGVERGRLFVKVVGLNDLHLPLPRSERVMFQLTLDNGLHCVTTTSLELGTRARIGQEFELVVLNDLEFQLTLTTRLPPPPKMPCSTPSSPQKSAKAQKNTGLSRFLTSPKKRAEKERMEREVAEAEERRAYEETQRKRASLPPTAWDLLHDLVNESDGSFARAYVNLAAQESACFGRAVDVQVPCYNEWALERDEGVVNSVRSKRAGTGPVRRPPYVVGQLQLQLLYVPRPKSALDDDMPRSMSAAVREMGQAREEAGKSVNEDVWEGVLSQQGGDCAHWRRRFFRLQGPKLTAYHEHTQQKRAVINLSKAARLVDDKSTLIADPTVPSSAAGRSPGKGRRKSAFAEEDEGYQYVEEGFRIRFKNGETIDFYADSSADKAAAMDALSKVIGVPESDAAAPKKASWTDLVLSREKVQPVIFSSAPKMGGDSDIRDPTKSRSTKDHGLPPKPLNPPPSRPTEVAKPAVERKESFRKAVPQSAPTSPLKASLPAALRSPVKAGYARAGGAPTPKRPSTPPMSERRAGRRREAVKSMIF